MHYATAYQVLRAFELSIFLSSRGSVSVKKRWFCKHARLPSKRANKGVNSVEVSHSAGRKCSEGFDMNSESLTKRVTFGCSQFGKGSGRQAPFGKLPEKFTSVPYRVAPTFLLQNLPRASKNERRRAKSEFPVDSEVPGYRSKPPPMMVPVMRPRVYNPLIASSC